MAVVKSRGRSPLYSPRIPRSDSRNSGARIIDYTSTKLNKLLLFLGLIKRIDLKMEECEESFEINLRIIPEEI